MTYLEALQTTLAAEHATVFVVGYLGAQTSESADPQVYAALLDSYAVHRGRRDDLVAKVIAAGGEPVAAEPSYVLDDVSSGGPAAILRRALRLERDCGSTYGYLAANAAPDERRWAIDAVVDSALRELALGGAPRTNPGR